MQTPKQAFEAAKFHSKYRGIEFKFSFDEWVLWWEKELGPDWLQKRGRRQGQFCMARFRDFGPYEIGNVKCVTSSGKLNPNWKHGTYSVVTQILKEQQA